MKRLWMLAGWALVAWMVALFTWSFLQWLYPLPEAAPAARKTTSSAPEVLWISNLDQHWVAAEESEEPAVVAPVQRSRLAVQVQGVLYSTTRGRSVVLLRYRNQDYTLSEGDELEPGLRLQEIQRDALIFNRNGQLERVDLELASEADPQERSALLDQSDQGERASQSASSRENKPTPERSQTSRDESPTEEPARQERVGTRALEEAFGPDFRESLVRDPLQLMRHITVSPHSEGGQLQGFRIRPGSDPELFNSLGLQEGDLVVAVDGTPVSDTSAMMGLQSQLATARAVDVELVRDGERLLFSLEME
ncbi:type II secretion system protein GspC [Marinospirillum sp.]|uniref:type II secretion system protein GspC n=1 Tax=Marinospirillum sp. TaxID=2183934 RepID=UPI003850CBD8